MKSDPTTTDAKPASGLESRDASVVTSPVLRLLDRWPVSLAVYSTFALFCCFLNLGGFGLISMEGMVADGARRMIESGEWAVPHVYGELYTFKPALAYWLSALPQLLSSEPSEWLLRLPFALSGALLGFGAVVLVGRLLRPRAGLFTGLAAVGTPLFLEKVRIAEFDTPLTFGVGVAVVAASCSLARREQKVFLWLLGYLGLSVAFLAKGTPALMAFAPGLFVAAWLTSSFSRLFGWRHLAGLSLFLLLIGAYLWWALREGGATVFDQPLSEGKIRGLQWTAPAFLRTFAKPLLILAAFLPWSLLLLLMRRASSCSAPRQRTVLRAGLGFLVGGMMAFTAVPTHEMRYYLPLTAAHALVAGMILEGLVTKPVPRRFTAALRGLLLLAAVLVGLPLVSLGLEGWLWAVMALALLAAVALLRRTSRGPTVVSLLVATSLVVAMGQACVSVPLRAEKRELSDVARQFDPLLPADAPVWVQGPADFAGKHASLYYYLDRPVRTFSSARPPPSGAYAVVVRGPEHLPVRLEAKTLAAVLHTWYEYRLVRLP